MDIDIILTNFICIFFVCNLIGADQIFFKAVKSPSVEIRGVYLPCNQEHNRNGKVHSNEKNFSNQCSKKIAISIKLINVGPSQIQNEFLVLNHVYDPIANATSQLLNPIVFKVKQEPITEVYDLKYLTRVNGEAKEVIKQACSHSRSHPVCGSQHVRSHKDRCCTCPSTKTSKYGREMMKRSCQHQSNSSRFQHIKESMLPNIETARLLKKKKVEGLSGISDVSAGVTSHSRKKDDDTPSLKNQMDIRNDDKSMYFVKADKGKDKYKISKMQPYSVDNLKSFGNYMSHDGDRSEIQQVSKLRKDAQNIFLEGASHYHGEKYDRKNLMHKEKYSFYNRGENIVDEETTDHNSRRHGLNQESFIKNPYSKDDTRENILENSQLENKIKSEMNENEPGVKVSEKENLLPVKYYDENILNLAKQGNGYAAFHNVIHQNKLNVFKGDDSQPFKQHRSGKENDRSSHEERLVLVPKGEKLSRIKIGIEYEQPKGKDDVKIELQKLPSEANRNSIPGEIKNKTRENMFELHCLTFSKLWYNVYEFRKPKIRHIVELEIFERHYSEESRTDWIDHTKGKILRVGSVNDSNKGQFGGSLLYKILEREENKSLNAREQQLLVPQLSNEIEISGHPGISDRNPGEYLVLPKHLLSLDGSECDKAGVGVKAFISSKDRCKAEQGSCLKNQPAALWQKDKDAKKSGGKTQFFLETFGKVSNDLFQTTMMEHSLQLGYYGKHISQIDVVVSVESNSLIHKGPAQITSVIVDAIDDVPTINVAVTNLGLGSASFTVELGECIPPMTKASTSSSSVPGLKSKKLSISPLHLADFSIQLCKGISHEKTRCIVLVQDEDGKTVAARRVTISKGVRCLCVWHCQCNCINSEVNLKCRLMPQDELLASGFKGTIPVILPITNEAYLATLIQKKNISCLLLYFILFIILLLLLGVCKVVLGLTYWKEVWVVGIPCYFCPKKMEKNQEESLAHEVQDNMTIHSIYPDLKKRSANKCYRFCEFLMNIFMFLLLPFVFLIWWPIHVCFISLCKKCAGYKWKFSISKFTAGSNSTSETSSFIPEDTEGSQSRCFEDCSEGTPSKSKSKSSEPGTRSTPNIPETDITGSQDHSHITFYTYDGTSDEQELRDVDYVMLQMRKSSSALQKARDRGYCITGSHRIFIAESIDEESSLSDIPSSFEIENITEATCKRRFALNKTDDTSRSRSVRDVLTNVEDTLSEVTTKDSLEAVTGSEAGLSSNAAQEFVERLRSKKFIFRNIDKIIGDVNFPEGRPYSIRGYFFNAPGGYKFIPPTPLWQYWTLGEDGETVVQLDPPMNLFASEFEKFYDSPQSVLEEGDLSMLPISTCVNVQFQHFDEDEFIQEISK